MTGLEVELRGTSPGALDELGGYYDAAPSLGGAPELVLDVERVTDFHVGRRRGPSYPAFETRVEGARLHLERFDAAGWLDLDATPLRGEFRVGDSPNSVEAVIRIGMSVALPRRGALILHSSCVADSRGAHVFSGVSGAGKSTIAAMLAEAYAGRVERLADELLIVAPDRDGDGWRVHVAPFLGIAGLPHGSSRPLASLNFLVQAPGHERTPVPRADAMRELLRHVLVYARDVVTADAVLGAVARLTAATPAYTLRFARDPGVGEVLGIT